MLHEPVEADFAEPCFKVSAGTTTLYASARFFDSGKVLVQNFEPKKEQLDQLLQHIQGEIQWGNGLASVGTLF